MPRVTAVRRIAASGLRCFDIGRLHSNNPRVQLRRLFDAHLLGRLDDAGRDFFFVQIGANDGVIFDSLYDHVTKRDVRGIVVEPVQRYFDELSVNYASYPRVTPVRAAIHATEKEVDLYRVLDGAVAEVGSWSKGIASVDPDHHKKSGTASKHMITERVPCMTWRELLEAHDVARIDFLQIDTEGKTCRYSGWWSTRLAGVGRRSSNSSISWIRA